MKKNITEDENTIELLVIPENVQGLPMFIFNAQGGVGIGYKESFIDQESAKDIVKNFYITLESLGFNLKANKGIVMGDAADMMQNIIIKLTEADVDGQSAYIFDINKSMFEEDEIETYIIPLISEAMKKRKTT